MQLEKECNVHNTGVAKDSTNGAQEAFVLKSIKAKDIRKVNRLNVFHHVIKTYDIVTTNYCWEPSNVSSGKYCLYDLALSTELSSHGLFCLSNQHFG
ncbi:hypothetical protein M8J76_000029 [Diaphorina citri]|nr:hypothetical protein M8J76_000029 [Diaphorina citri]